MKKEKERKMLALLLSLSLIFSSQLTAVFAEEPEPATEPGEEVTYQLNGKVYQYAYSASESSGSAKSGVDVTITFASGSTTLTTASDGSFEYVFTDDAERTSTGKYSYSIDADDEHYAATGQIEEGTSEEPVENRINIRERYIPSASDYQFIETDKVKKVGSEVWVKEPGTYDIKGTSGKKLSPSLDGTSSDTLSVTVSGNGLLSNFFIFIGNLCSKILTGQSVHVDSGAPEITSVTTTAAANGTFVREHGIYGRTKAEVAVNAVISEEAGVKEAYLVSHKGEETIRYDATIAGGEGRYSATIGLPDNETIMDAQLVRLVVVDIFGNASEETLIQQTEAGSSVTLEQIAPDLSKKVTGKHSEYGWYSELPTLSAKASDTLSGLARLTIYNQEGAADKTITEDRYDEKTLEEHSIEGVIPNLIPISSSGEYVYKAEAVDNSGNTATDEYHINVDLEAPKIEAEGAKTGEYYQSNPVIKITEDEMYWQAKGNRIFVKVQRDGRTVLETVYGQVNTATIPAATFNADGVYAVSIYAKDAADNESNHISYTFTKDATAPTVAISGVKEGKFYNKPQTVSVTVKEHNYSNNDVSVTAIKKLGNAKKNMGFPWKNKAVETVNSKKFSEIGTYTITASARDKAGNQSKTKKVSFTVDTKAPVITITGVQDKGVYTYGQGVAPKVTVTDDYLASKSIVYTKAGERIADPSFAQLKENDGAYTLTVSATDKAGNSAKKEISFVVNRFGSWFEYNDAIKNIQGKAVQNVENDLVITERNVSLVTESDAQIYRDGNLQDTKGKTSADEAGPEKTYRHTFAKASFEDEGAYEINVRSKDEVGNEMESKVENGLVKFFVDRTEPTITLSGIDPKGNQAESITVEIRAADTLTGITDVKATIDGEPAGINEQPGGDLSIEVGEGLRQTIAVTAVDGAGNEAKITESASVSTSAALLFLSRFWYVIAGLAAALLGILIFLIARRKKQKEED